MSNSAHQPLRKIRTFQTDKALAQGVVHSPVPEPSTTKGTTPPVSTVTVKKRKKEKVQTSVSISQAKPIVKATPLPEMPTPIPQQSKPPIQPVRKKTNPKPKTVIVQTKAQPVSPPHIGEGDTIVVTAKRRSQFRLFPALVAACTAWIKNITTPKTTVPTFTVTAAEQRTDVIRRATTTSGVKDTTDIESLKAELAKKREAPPTTIPKPLNVTWSLQTETGIPLLEEAAQPLPLPARPSVTIERKSFSVPPVDHLPTARNREAVLQPRMYTPPTPPEVDNRWQEVANEIPDSPYQPLPANQTPVFSIPETFPIHTPPSTPNIPQPVAPVPISVPEPVITPLGTVQTERIAKPAPKKDRRTIRTKLRNLFTWNTNITTVLTAGSVITLVMFFLIVQTFMTIIDPTTTDEQTPLATTEPLTTMSTIIDVTIPTISRETILAEITAQDRPASGVVEFRLVSSEGDAVRPQLIWDTLGFSTNLNLSRSISELHFGYALGDSVIMFTASDPLTVFGALLSWESVMAAELQPLFTVPKNVGNQFIDMSIGTRDVRILTYEGGEVLVYGFLNEDTVVITESLDAYNALLSKDY